jgi:hypothetical protein
MSLFNKVSKFARSPQGRRMADQAMRAAKDPKTKRQIQQLRSRMARGKGPAR